MKKTFYSSLSFVAVIVMAGCGGNDLIQEKSQTVSMQHQNYVEPQKPLAIGAEQQFDNAQQVKSLRVINTTDVDLNDVREKGLTYINTLRQKAGMITFSAESHLDASAYNHAHYLMINNVVGHGESNVDPGYTGATQLERAVYAGYPHRKVSENLSAGNSSVYDSVDGLFSAIYHRFGFLSFAKDEMGIGVDVSQSHSLGNAYVYDMGVSQLKALCGGKSYKGKGSYYYGVCDDPQFKIKQARYDRIISRNARHNPKYVLWPYADQTDAVPVFFEEVPDPLPECSVSGYPVSIQFNPVKSGDIALQSFKLYYDANGTEIADTKLLDKDTDPNNRLSSDEYALFPMKRLEWDTKYRAVVSYTENNIPKDINWTFKTKALPYPYYKIVQKENTLNIKSGQTYLLYLPPESCNEGAGYSMTYSGDITIENDFYDYNTIKIKVTGTSGFVKVFAKNGRNITLTVAQNDSAIYPATSPETGKKAQVKLPIKHLKKVIFNFWKKEAADN